MPSRASTIALLGGSLRERTPPTMSTWCPGQIVEQFAQRREQVRRAIVAHLLDQGGMKTAYDSIQRNGRRRGAGDDGCPQFLGGNSRGQIARLTGSQDRRAKRRPSRVDATRCLASVRTNCGRDRRRHCTVCRPARTPTGRGRRSATSERHGRNVRLQRMCDLRSADALGRRHAAFIKEGSRGRNRALVQVIRQCVDSRRETVGLKLLAEMHQIRMTERRVFPRRTTSGQPPGRRDSRSAVGRSGSVRPARNMRSPWPVRGSAGCGPCNGPARRRRRRPEDRVRATPGGRCSRSPIPCHRRNRL